MIISRVVAIAGLAIAVGIPRFATDATDVPRCSLAPFPGVRGQGSFFVGTATRDTALVGPGSVTPSGVGGHWGKGAPRAVHGQVVRIDMLGDTVTGALSAEHRTVIVVPWDYDAGCDPTYWSRSAAWVDAGLEGFYTIRLRPVEAWAGKTPVGDAFFADLQPYPHGAFFRAGYHGTNALRERDALTPREYFSLYSALPTGADFGDSRTALARLKAWQDANPILAARYPADQILVTARRRLETQQ